eukprot:GHVR01140203.1.p1 GENE.GHVR01140203.1~~GHVR01140203.1.p1  ORF type:complete len:374 (-),score=142.08 GHVR01140203.1:11-1132(-)
MTEVPDILNKINKVKEEEVRVLLSTLSNDPTHPIHDILKRKLPIASHPRVFERSLMAASAVPSSHLTQGSLGVIAEIKRKSPSVGSIDAINDPVALAREYELSGACCVSCLTDKQFFGGNIYDLNNISKSINIPVLRKDFIIHPVQIAEAIHNGATGVLLIVASLGHRVNQLLNACNDMGICALVEVHDEEEARVAVKYHARIVGVNNRNLNTFVVDMSTSERLSTILLPSIDYSSAASQVLGHNCCVRVAESGIHTHDDCIRMRKAGYNAVLVGEALVRASDKRTLMQSFTGSLHNDTDTHTHTHTHTHKPILKICGVSNDETAAVVGGCADVIGLVFHPKSPRFVGGVTEAKKIISGVHTHTHTHRERERD